MVQIAFGKDFDVVEALRGKADYNPFSTITQEQAEEVLQKAEKFVEEVRIAMDQIRS